MNFFAKAEYLFSDPAIESAFGFFQDNHPAFLQWGFGKNTSIECLPFFAKKPKSFLWEDFLEKYSFSEQLFAAPGEQRPLPRLRNRTWKSDETNWKILCKKISDGINASLFEKIVPTRFKSAEINDEEKLLLSKNIFEQLCTSELPGTYRFALKAKNSIFFGATPELLYKRKNGKIFIPAIAGTKYLSAQKNMDSLSQELLASEKDRREHHFVVTGIQAALETLGLKASYQEIPQTRSFGKLMHLYTPIVCEDKIDIPSDELIKALHPTAAIGGFPQRKAFDFLHKEEPWDRGLYSSPFKIFLPEEELCLVSIRSALLKENTFYLFAGAGFVRGSDPEQEWIETERKMSSMGSLFFEEG